MISVLDYGAGNCGSVIRMIQHVGGNAKRITTSEEIISSEKLLIPGVGSFDYGMNQLFSRDLISSLNYVALYNKIPILGICLGMQLMCNSSEEGILPGLKWIDGDVCHLDKNKSHGLPIPHMGWNFLNVIRNNKIIPYGKNEIRFYFLHSYHVLCHNNTDPISLTNYGNTFVSAFNKKNIFGVQFHPEKSHRFGMDLMIRFLEI